MTWLTHLPQVSACIPILRWFSRIKVLFYCHFPDMVRPKWCGQAALALILLLRRFQLLTQRRSLLKRIYRAPLDWLEETTTGMAHMVMVRVVKLRSSRLS